MPPQWVQAAQMRGQAADTAAVKATVFTQVCLEQLRRDLHAFATNRHKDQHHTPRNILLALIAEVGGCYPCSETARSPNVLAAASGC